MLIRCPTCKGRGKVNKAYPPGTVMGYCDREGNRWPQEQCQSCAGVGWVEDGTAARRAPVAPSEGASQ